jgi:hypothetical protein
MKDQRGIIQGQESLVGRMGVVEVKSVKLVRDVNENSSYGAITIKLRHPSLELEELVAAIDLPTSQNWRADDVLYRGDKLPSRLRGENYWCSKKKLHEGVFSDELNIFITKLWNEKDRVIEFCKAGGKVEIYLQLDGKKNVGDSISNSMLRKISELGAELDVETFPNITNWSD